MSTHLEELSDGDPVEGVCLLAAEYLEEHVLHIGKVRGLGCPSGPEIGLASSATDFVLDPPRIVTQLYYSIASFNEAKVQNTTVGEKVCS